ncbi:hypothetical protein KKE48_00130 [Patescibacteria group bacterium]|nr:hypothetical protein [Patescibacteria group bacterium]MBU1499263.1 hypothetical protein [Patescibacteria group bacterium]
MPHETERTKVAEIELWQQKAERLQKRRDRLVALSIPGWVSMAVVLPQFFNEALNSHEPIVGWLKIAAPLAVLAGWGVFEAAEYTEKARLQILSNLERAGVDISAMLTAGKFPWIRHFADGEPIRTKIARVFRR